MHVLRHQSNNSTLYQKCSHEWVKVLENHWVQPFASVHLHPLFCHHLAKTPFDRTERNGSYHLLEGPSFLFQCLYGSSCSCWVFTFILVAKSLQSCSSLSHFILLCLYILCSILSVTFRRKWFPIISEYFGISSCMVIVKVDNIETRITTPELLLGTFDFNGENIVAILGGKLCMLVKLRNVHSIYSKIIHK